MAELIIPIREYIGKSEWNWETGEFEWATNADEVRMMVEWAQYDGQTIDSICLEIGVCFGGSTFDGKAIYHYLQGLKVPIRTRIYSFAASMATILMLAGDTCEIDASAQLLVHGPSGETWGTVTDVQSGLKMLTNEHEALRDIYVARTGQPAEVVDEWMSKDTFFTASEALAAGLVTKVIPIAPKAAPALSTAQASARRAKFAGIVARAAKRPSALSKPKPKAAAKRPAANASPLPMAKTVIPISQAAGKKPVALTAQQKANNAAVAAFAKQLGVKATIEGTEVAEVTAVAEPTTLADGAGTLYTDGPLAVDSAVFNDEALTDPTADGVYGAEDGRDITVASGIVTELTDASAESEEEETPAAAAGTEAITAAITAALTPFITRLDSMEGQVTAFSKAVPPVPKSGARAAGAPQVDPKAAPKPKAKGVLAGASSTKE